MVIIQEEISISFYLYTSKYIEQGLVENISTYFDSIKFVTISLGKY